MSNELAAEEEILDGFNFYDTRFHIGFSKQDKADLVAFLRSL